MNALTLEVIVSSSLFDASNIEYRACQYLNSGKCDAKNSIRLLGRKIEWDLLYPTLG